MKNKFLCFILCFTFCLVSLFMVGCKGDMSFEGEICELEYKEPYSTTIVLPVSIYNGHSTTIMMIPYIRSYPDRYYVKVRNYNQSKNEYTYNECYVTKECFSKLKIGDWFIYNKDYCFENEPYSQVRE